MKYKLFLNKIGFSVFAQLLVHNIVIILPISFSVSLFAIGLCDKDFFKTVFIISAIIQNILIGILSNLVVINDNIISIRPFFLKKQEIQLGGIYNIKILSNKEFKALLSKKSELDPIVSNCFSLIIPMNNVVHFKDKFGRDIALAVWNYKSLYAYINKFKCIEKSPEVDFSNKYHLTKSFFVKCPIVEYIKIYFKHFFTTIIIPLFYAGLVILCFKSSYIWLSIVVFTIFSFLAFCRLIIFSVNNTSKYIVFSCFSNYDENNIKFDSIRNLHFVYSAEEITTTMKCGGNVIATPYTPTKFNKMVGFDLDYDTHVYICSNKTDELYNLLETEIQ